MITNPETFPTHLQLGRSSLQGQKNTNFTLPWLLFDPAPVGARTNSSQDNAGCIAKHSLMDEDFD